MTPTETRTWHSEKRQLSKNQVLTGRIKATLLTATFKLIEPLTFVNVDLIALVLSL